MLILGMRPSNPGQIDWVSSDGFSKSQLQHVVHLVIMQFVVSVKMTRHEVDNTCVL